MAEISIKRIPVIKVTNSAHIDKTDALAVEEPLEIRLKYLLNGEQIVKSISVTMRTPGNDPELAAGFLFTEGIIKHQEEIDSIAHCFIACTENKENTIEVTLKEGTIPNLR